MRLPPYGKRLRKKNWPVFWKIVQVFEYEEMMTQTKIRNERLVILERILGLAQLCCSSTWLARTERQRAVVAAVQRAQQRSREAHLCQGFLVWRASEQISLPCQRSAHWTAMAVVAARVDERTNERTNERNEEDTCRSNKQVEEAFWGYRSKPMEHFTLNYYYHGCRWS